MTPKCIHEEVCQHRIENMDAGESCTVAKVCRYYETGKSMNKLVKRKYTRHAKPDAEKRLYFKTATTAQKEQIINIAKDL
jgi:hypothetical protein